MHDIICHNCKKAFKIDEAGYADILRQVRDAAFEQQLHERLELAEQEKRSAVELAKSAVTNELQRQTAAKDAEIQQLKAQLDAGEVDKKLAVSEALKALEKERDKLSNELKQHVADEIGPIAKPAFIVFADSLPKTRSGKIMRRVLKARALGQEEGDLTTLEE